MTSASKCPRCGARLAHAARACSACLFDLALGSPAAPQAPVADSAASAASGSGADFVPPTLEEVAQALPGFDQLAPLGRGGMGSVFRAREIALERTVAIKVLPRELGARADFRERFLREARALARLNHPNVVNVHGAGEADGPCYLVMEFVDGRNLRELLREKGVSAEEALRIVRALCDALQYTHDEGVVHRDLKPENVLIDRTGRVKLADFGLAKLVGVERDPHLTRTDQVMGTPHYMAPEQLERPHDVDHRADLFALGVILYELLTGSLPRGAFEPPSHRVSVDVRLDEIVLKALEREPARRYQHALEVKGDVDELDRPASAPSASTRAPQSTSSQPGKLVAQLAIAVLFAAYCIALAWSWNHGALALGVVGALLAPLTAFAVWLGLRHERELAPAIATASAATWSLRGAGALVALAAGWIVVVTGHLAKWESGGSNWSPALRGAHALLEAWRRDPWSLVRLCGVDPLGVQDPRITLVNSFTSESFSDLSLSAPLWLGLGALLFLALAVRALVDPPQRELRSSAWRFAGELASCAVAGLLVLWVAAPLVADRAANSMTGVSRSLSVPSSPAEVRRRFDAELASRGFELSVAQRGALNDGRSGRDLAEVHFLRAQHGSLFGAWRTSWSGPQRRSPQVWATLAGNADKSHTNVQLNAGLYRSESPEALAASKALDELAAALERD